MYFNLKSTLLLSLITVAVASPTNSELYARKIDKDVNCGGTVIKADQIGTTYSEASKKEDNTVGNMPHTYGNAEGLFNKATDLKEFPLLQEGVWNGRGEKGKFRVVWQKKKSKKTYKGVMYEKNVGAGMTQCTEV
ncbi:Ribonuclease/ribotoxin [Annulohypoxylon moriforme]|nr:Ribonuclease/ribotoxin [Annulohypoxylon moriforme]